MNDRASDPLPPPGEMARWTRLGAATAMLATVAVVFLTAGDRPWQAVASVLMIGLLPYVALVALSRWASGVVLAEAAVLASLLLAVFFAAGLYLLAFVIQPGPRTTSAPVAVPLLQSAAVTIAGVGASLAKWKSR